jgi:hypothetical protein
MNRSPVRHAAMLLSLALASALVGCPPEHGLFGPATTVRTVRETASPAAERPGPVIVCVRVAVVNVPIGAARESEDIWARLQGGSLDPNRQNTLNANALRAGLAPARSLVDLVGVLQGLTGKQILYATIPAISEAPCTVTLRADEPARTFFTISQDRSARGVDYPAGEYVLAISGRVDDRNPSHVLLTVMPEIRAAAAETQIVQTNGRVTFQTHHPILPLEEAAVTVDMPTGDVLVIGPWRQAHRPSSIGYGFLTRDTSGIPFETVILLVPLAVSESP